MTSIVRILEDCLSGCIARDGQPARYCVAFSGGIDSTVLLHALSRLHTPIPLLAIHVDHQLCAASAAWERHCRGFSASLGIEYIARRADVALQSGMGPEGAARAARYGIFETLVRENDWLLSAHHGSDQAETLLLNLFRGSGPAGLAGIGTSRPFAKGRLVRPLLAVSKEQIEDYARRENLSWADDPSNLDDRFDRNFLRNDILPTLVSRWPASIARLMRSAELATEASELLDDLAAIDLAVTGEIGRLDVGMLAQLPPARQRNLLRYAIRRLGLPSAPATRLTQILDELIAAREDAQPLVKWQGAEVRRYRDKVYLLATEYPSSPVNPAARLCAGSPLQLTAGLGSLNLTESDGTGIDPALATAGLQIRFRSGGESIRPTGRKHTHKLKKLLQDAAIVPWMRARIPLLFAGDSLVAVADLWIAAESSAESGYEVRWDNRPEIT